MDTIVPALFLTCRDVFPFFSGLVLTVINLNDELMSLEGLISNTDNKTKRAGE